MMDLRKRLKGQVYIGNVVDVKNFKHAGGAFI